MEPAILLVAGLLTAAGTAAYRALAIRRGILANPNFRSLHHGRGRKTFSKPADYVPTFRLRDGRGRETVEDGQPGDHFVFMLQHSRQMMDDEQG